MVQKLGYKTSREESLAEVLGEDYQTRYYLQNEPYSHVARRCDDSLHLPFATAR
jgi:hypothetical protein